jgi:hypothetical protein
MDCSSTQAGKFGHVNCDWDRIGARKKKTGDRAGKRDRKSRDYLAKY